MKMVAAASNVRFAYHHSRWRRTRPIRSFKYDGSGSLRHNCCNSLSGVIQPFLQKFLGAMCAHTHIVHVNFEHLCDFLIRETFELQTDHLSERQRKSAHSVQELRT